MLHSTSLTVLDLDWLEFGLSDSLFSGSLSSLRTLSLKSASLDDEMLHSFILGCPSLEKSCLEGCTNSHDPNISSMSLKYFEAQETRFRTIQVEAPNLPVIFIFRHPRYAKLYLH